MEGEKRREQRLMGHLVDGLGSASRSADENVTPPKDQPFPRHVHTLSKKSSRQESYEDAQEVSGGVWLLPSHMESPGRLFLVQSLLRDETKRESSDIHCQAGELVPRQGHFPYPETR